MPPQSTDQLKARVARLKALNKRLKNANQKLHEENQTLTQANHTLAQAKLDAEEQNATNSAKLAVVLATAFAAVNSDLRPPLQVLTQVQGILANTKLADATQDKNLRRTANRLKRSITSVTRTLDSLTKLNATTYLKQSPPDQQTSLPSLAQSPQSKTPRPAPRVYVADGDQVVLNTTRAIHEEAGHTVEAFNSAATFLDAYPPNDDGCILVDVLTLEIDGFELIERLRTTCHRLPSIIVTSQGNAEIPLRAMKEGAADFIEKPINPDELLAAVRHILDNSPGLGQITDWQENAMAKVTLLSARERQVLAFVVEGHPSKNIAADLGVSQRTIENHRASIMRKMGAKSLAQLVRLVLASERMKRPSAPTG